MKKSIIAITIATAVAVPIAIKKHHSHNRHT